MILVNMKMTVLPSKRKEFLQTVQALVQSIRKMKGCIYCSAFQDLEEKNSFCMIQKWENQKELDSYLQSDLFEVLLGTKNFLFEPWEIFFTTVSTTSGR
jgi:quinol monooxygenase YgiN